MARTFRRESYRWYNKETKSNRKRTNRVVRKSNKNFLQHAIEYDPDEVLFDPPPHTEGWETH